MNDAKDDLAERLHASAEAIRDLEWLPPITASEDIELAARVIEYLENPAVLLTIPQPHRLRLSELLHGKAVRS